MKPNHLFYSLHLFANKICLKRCIFIGKAYKKDFLLNKEKYIIYIGVVVGVENAVNEISH